MQFSSLAEAQHCFGGVREVKACFFLQWIHVLVGVGEILKACFCFMKQIQSCFGGTGDGPGRLAFSCTKQMHVLGRAGKRKACFLLYEVDTSFGGQLGMRRISCCFIKQIVLGGSCGGEVHVDTIVLGGVGNGKACFFFIKQMNSREDFVFLYEGVPLLSVKIYNKVGHLLSFSPF